VRSPGLVMQWRGPHLNVRSKQNKGGHWLNQTAALIWFLCDGQARVGDLIDHLQSRYPDQTGQVASDVNQALAELRARGLLSFADQPQAVRPLIKVGFAGFGPGFFAGDNYFLWMLTHKFDVEVVIPEQETPDLLFYRAPPKESFDHRRIDRTQTLKVLVSADGLTPDFSECDYAFSPNFVTGRFAEQHCQVPVWSFYLDWETYDKSETAFSDQRLPVLYKPERVCARLYDALLGFSQCGPEKRSSPPPHTPGSHTTGRPAVSHNTPQRLTIGMATYDDFDGAYFTIQGIRLYHPEIKDGAEVLIIDNHPEGDIAQSLQRLAASIPGCRYVAHSEVRGTAPAKELVFREAKSEYVLCVDSHVLLAPGSISRLIAYLDGHPECGDLLQGPLVYDDLTRISTHFEPVWSAGMYGRWGTDERGNAPDNDPFEIPMQGLGVFACRKESWVGFNPRFSGFGGEEGYLHEKFRQAGRRTLCLPFLRWTHRFGRPLGTSYRNVWEDRIRNYYIGFQELELDTAPVDEHFQSLLGVETYERIKQQVCEELANPFFYFDAIYCINLDSALDRWQAMQERFRRLGIADRVRRFSAVETPESHHIGCSLSHRRIIERAQKQGLQNVLVFEDDALFMEETLQQLARSIEELKTQPWKIFHLGGHKWGRRFRKAQGCRFLESPCEQLTCSHAVAYHHSIYRRILDDLPGDIEAMRAWISNHCAIDQYLQGLEGRYAAFPVVSSQPSLLPQEDAAHRDRFTI